MLRYILCRYLLPARAVDDIGVLGRLDQGARGAGFQFICSLVDLLSASDEIDTAVIRIATGEFSEDYFEGFSFGRIKIPDYATRIDDISDAIDFDFTAVDLCEATCDFGQRALLLALKNDILNHINSICLDQIPCDNVTELVSADSWLFMWVSHKHNGDPADALKWVWAC